MSALFSHNNTSPLWLAISILFHYTKQGKEEKRIGREEKKKKEEVAPMWDDVIDNLLHHAHSINLVKDMEEKATPSFFFILKSWR